MKVLLILIAFILLVGWDLPKIIRNNHKKELIVYSSLMLVGLTLSLLVSFHVPLPNPTKGLEALFKPFSLLLTG